MSVAETQYEMSIKRKSSPSPSSRSSVTPAPNGLLQQSTDLTPNGVHLESSPIRDDIAGPSRISASATPVPVVGGVVKEERTVAKAGVIQLNSGDGPGCGDECFLWTDLPMNKQGYRYVPCAPSPNRSPAPLFPFYRTLPGAPPAPPVHLSWVDRSSFLRLSNDALTATTDRGYRSGRASVSVRQGSWYYEVLIQRGNGDFGAGGKTGGDVGNAHVRLGWGRREANMDAPVGMDAYGYGVRDVGGEKVHLSRPKPYGRGFKTGDVIGCLINLPERPEDLSKIKRKRVAIRYKGQLYFEMDEYAGQKEMEALVDREGKVAAAARAAAEAAKHAVPEEKERKVSKKGATTKNTKKGKMSELEEPSGPVVRDLPILPGSSIAFYLNGESLGTAFEDLYDYLPLPPLINPSHQTKKGHHPEPSSDTVYDDGTLGYFPMISCFGRGKVKMNFGPNWLAPPVGLEARSISDRWDEFRAEEEILDDRDEEEAAERMKKELEAEEERQRMALLNPTINGDKKKSMSRKKQKGLEGTPVPSSEAATPTPMPMSLEGAETPGPAMVEDVKVEDVQNVADLGEVAGSGPLAVDPRVDEVKVEPEPLPEDGHEREEVETAYEAEEVL